MTTQRLDGLHAKTTDQQPSHFKVQENNISALQFKTMLGC